MVIAFRESFMFYQIFLSPKKKRNMIIAPAANASERGGILVLPHVRDAGIFSKLIVFFFSQEIFL